MPILNDLPVKLLKALLALPLSVEQVIRTIPNRRYVCSGMFNHQAVYAKIFTGKSAKAYGLRDKLGAERLLNACILSPELLLADTLSEDAYILIYAAVKNAHDAEEVWLKSAVEQRFLLMKQLLETVAHHHQAGLLQTDLHLKNFLVQKTEDQEELIYTIDGDGIRRLSSIFKKRKKLHNLATLFSKMDVLDDVWIAELYGQYCLRSGMKTSPQAEAEVWYLVQRIRHQVTKNYASKKVFRTCTDVKVLQSVNAYTAVANGFRAEDFTITKLDSALASYNQNLKNGSTCTIARSQVGDIPVVIKRYNIKNFWHGLNRAFRVSRAAKSWENAHWLMMSGIMTPKPVALVEARLGRLRRHTYFVSEYVPGPDISQYFNATTDKALAAQKIAALFYKLYLLRISHGDCKASNIIMVNDEPVLIDLDSMRAHAVNWFAEICFEWRHVKDLKRLMKNWKHDPDMLAMLKSSFWQKYKEQYPIDRSAILDRAGIHPHPV
jgi:tRNA A-37 threonylcarbamoyl transferase component Bud32